MFVVSFSTWADNITSYIGSEEDVFWNKKQKNDSEAQPEKQFFLFIIFFVISFFSFSPLHVKPNLLYILKDDSFEGL